MNQTPLLLSRILYGGDYNPEQWPEHIWDEDIRWMQQAGWNIVTLPVFGWVALQPEEERFNFGWLDKILGKLHAGGIDVCMATATASVPKWLGEKYPEVLLVNANGQRLQIGGRHAFCPNSPQFRRLSTGLVRQIATRYAGHPTLKLWHVGNEYGGNGVGGRCYCDLCNLAFRDWLKDRYGSLEELNERWDTAFWGHTYTSWEQLRSPVAHGERTIQALRIDYDRFQSQSLLSCYRAEANVLREITPNVPVTTNMMGPFKPIHYHKWAQEVDIVAWDCYPVKSAPFAQTAFAHALMRGLRDGQPWLLMEQTASQSNWQTPSALKPPGTMRLLSYQAIAHGAESVMYFQWRRTSGGIEKFHGAIIEHSGTTETRVFREVSQLGHELQQLKQQTLGGRTKSKVALLFDWENWWTLDYATGPNRELNYQTQCELYFAALHEQGIQCDVISPDSDFSKYQLLIAPMMYLVKTEVAAKIEQFVSDGGSFFTTFLSGIADECDSVHLGGYPGLLRKMLGIWVEEIDNLEPQETNQMVFNQPFGELSGSITSRYVVEQLHLEGAQALATFNDSFFKGAPAVTHHQYGEGESYYVASAIENPALRLLFKEICQRNGIEPLLAEVPEGVEVASRISPDGSEVLYLLNHSTSEKTITLPSGTFSELLTQSIVTGTITLGRYEVGILSKHQHP